MRLTVGILMVYGVSRYAEVTMQRTQILLEAWQVDALKSLSEREGKSVSNMIRELVAARLAALRTEGSIEDIAGIARGRRHPGRDHDAILYGRRRRSKA